MYIFGEPYSNYSYGRVGEPIYALAQKVTNCLPDSSDDDDGSLVSVEMAGMALHSHSLFVHLCEQTTNE